MKRAPRRDDALDRARTIFWFEYLGTRIGTFRPRDVQRAVAPLPDFDARGGVIKNNTFLSYSRGDRVPRADVIKKVADLFPASEEILKHVLWDVLRIGNAVDTHARRWVWQLDPNIQKAVVNTKQQFCARSRTLQMLERRPCLDSLALMVMLFRMSRDTLNSEKNPHQDMHLNMWMYACAIFRMLVLLGPTFLTDKARTYVFDLFVQRIFTGVTTVTGVRFALEHYDYVYESELLLFARRMFRIGGEYSLSGTTLRREELSLLDKLIRIPMTRIPPEI